MYRSNVMADTVTIDNAHVTYDVRRVTMTREQLEISRNGVTKEKIERGMPKTPTLKSTTDWRSMTK
jgi:hypothetical protein